jgi:hypothetical protein
VKKIVIVVVIVFVVVVGLYRERIFVRDPLGKVSRGGVEVGGAHVYINYLNDVLIEGDGAEAPRYLVQRWNKVPGTPAVLRCLYLLTCWTDADHATMVPVVERRGYDPQVTMGDKEISYMDGAGARVTISLR